METPSRMTALDLVLRERDAIAALPSTVYAIRRFAQAPLSKRFKYILSKRNDSAAVAANVAALEQFLLLHAEDRRFEALESDHDPDDPDDNYWLENVSSTTKCTLPRQVLSYGAQVGSVPIVKWTINTHPGRDSLFAGLTAAVANERMSVVELLYPLVPNFSINDEKSLVVIATKHGRVGAVEWLFAQRSWAREGLSRTTANAAAETGQLAVLQWVHAAFPDSVSWNVLQEAALRKQQHILDWFYDTGIQISHFWLMWAAKQVLHGRNVDAVMWIHEKYPSCSFPLADLEEFLASTRDVSTVRKLITAFPKQYVSQGLVFGATQGDLELVKAHTLDRKVKNRELKRAMHRAAGRGHVAVIEYLHEFSHGTWLPATVLWRALRCGYMDVVRWVLEQKPTLRRRERLVEMRDASARQLPSNVKGDMKQVTQWLDTQLACLMICHEVTQASHEKASSKLSTTEEARCSPPEAVSIVECAESAE